MLLGVYLQVPSKYIFVQILNTCVVFSLKKLGGKLGRYEFDRLREIRSLERDKKVVE